MHRIYTKSIILRFHNSGFWYIHAKTLCGTVTCEPLYLLHLLLLFTEFFKKFAEHGAAFFFQYAPLHIYLMVEFGHFQEVQDGTGAARLRIHGPR